MKKPVVVLMIILICVSTALNAGADENTVSIKIDGKPASIHAGEIYLNSDNRTMVPARSISEGLGCEVSSEVPGSISIRNKSVRIDFNVGDFNAWIMDLKTNASKLEVFDTKFVVKDGKTMVPIRFISDMLGAKVNWDGTLNEVNIYSPGNYIKSPEPGFYNRIYLGKVLERQPYKPNEPFKIEYDGITKEDVDNDPILGGLIQLPNCTYVSKMRSVTSGQLQYRFVYKEININNNNNLDTVFAMTLNSDLNSMSFWIEKYNTLSLGLLRNTLAILYGGDTEAQDALYQQILKQRMSEKSYTNESFLKSYGLALYNTNDSLWEEDGFKVWGTVQKINQ